MGVHVVVDCGFVLQQEVDHSPEVRQPRVSQGFVPPVEEKETRYQAALRQAVEEALATYGPQAAVIEETVPDTPGLWCLEVQPTAEGAAPASIAYLGGADEIVVGFGRTHMYMWNDDHHQLAREVRDLLEAVFAAKFVEAGAEQDAYSIVSTRSGMKGVGKMHLPWPWRLRRTQTYSPYGPPPN